MSLPSPLPTPLLAHNPNPSISSSQPCVSSNHLLCVEVLVRKKEVYLVYTPVLLTGEVDKARDWTLIGGQCGFEPRRQVKQSPNTHGTGHQGTKDCVTALSYPKRRLAHQFFLCGQSDESGSRKNGNPSSKNTLKLEKDKQGVFITLKRNLSGKLRCKYNRR